ncbi:hypothetical protein HY504_02490 [Candidatus Wolfebacteria bacterium]|nr:hypothetical protein [Candidatus Wolfebacteria bacterium]
MISATLNNLITDLKPRERDVLDGRFGLTRGKRQTLAEIGEEYDITRERVRQIEAEALLELEERARREKAMDEIAARLLRHLEDAGGLRREDLFLNEARDLLDDVDLHEWHLVLFSHLFRKPLFEDNEEDLHPVWYTERKKLLFAKKFIVQLERSIRAKKDELVSEGVFPVYLKRAADLHGISDAVGMNYVLISRRFATNPFGDVGLIHWEEIVPKTMGSKAYLVLKKHRKPLHFRDIAEHINQTGFDPRRALPQTIHNELIKDPRFVLVGRGMYGLREHGFTPGTTREVVREILKKQGPLAMQHVIDAVLGRRFLERNTIVLNLQNRKYFKRLPDGRYAIK